MLRNSVSLLKFFIFIVLIVNFNAAFADANSLPGSDSSVVKPITPNSLKYKCYGAVQQTGSIIEKDYDSCTNLYVGGSDPQCGSGYVAIGTRSWTKYWGPIAIGQGCALQCRAVIAPASNCRWE